MTSKEKLKQDHVKCIKGNQINLISKSNEKFYNNPLNEPYLYLFLYPDDTFAFKRKSIERLRYEEPYLFGIGRSGLHGEFTNYGYEYSHSESSNTSHVIFHQNGIIEVGTNSTSIFEKSKKLIYTRNISSQLSACLNDYKIYIKDTDPEAKYTINLIIKTPEAYSLYQDKEFEDFKDIIHKNYNNIIESSFEDIDANMENINVIKKKILDSTFSSWGLPYYIK
ncbi:hypothetical protein [Leptospira levettii]|uniref:hypothetical protein n=1 Tax=Leptospira levettii TaxID=2023178 RepID=UPI0010826FAD|nr:hypothetical protein [Leptospira levettii]TGM33907.1 hypothetical protein EHQ71_00015 [Leptospira levettii]TGM85385.1 hypothetical protein EHR00_04820 [Leptospira levettii]